MISRSRSTSTEEPTKDIIIQNNVKASKKMKQLYITYKKPK